MPPQSGARSAAGGAKARPRPLRPGFPPLAGWLLLLLHAVLLLWVASRQSVTFDESFHLPAGVRILARGDFLTSYAQPPLAKTLAGAAALLAGARSVEHTSELQSLTNLVCRLLLEQKIQTVMR